MSIYIHKNIKCSKNKMYLLCYTFLNEERMNY